jgi:hypothetical protein
LRWVDDPSSLEKELVLSCLGLSNCAGAPHQNWHRTHGKDAYHLSSVHAQGDYQTRDASVATIVGHEKSMRLDRRKLKTAG